MIQNLKVLVLALLILSSCAPTKNQTQEKNPGVSYAERFSVEQFEAYKILHVNQLWQGSDEKADYLLYEDELPTDLDLSKYVVMEYPLQSLVSNSTTHLAFLEVLGVADRLKGFAQSQYIYSDFYRERLDSGQLKEIGSEGQVDAELVLSLEPDAFLAFSSGMENRQLNKLEELGQTIVMTPDYLESTLLGRAEWIKFFGSLTGKEQEATAYFDMVVASYDSLKRLVAEVEAPAVMSGSLYGGSWFMPAGNNYNSILIREAGGSYLWAESEGSGWLNLDFEAVYAKAFAADYWIGVSDYKSLDELVTADERYGKFKAVKEGRVYGYTKRLSPSGGNDYFESGNANPHILLADHIKILHPELLPDHELYYYERLE